MLFFFTPNYEESIKDQLLISTPALNRHALTPVLFCMADFQDGRMTHLCTGQHVVLCHVPVLFLALVSQ